MKSFKRIFKYIWPQWHRLVVIVVSAMMIGLLFAFSIGTVLPLLKVMMGEEGLHGWIDRLIARDRYGVSFYVPDKIDLSDPNKRDIVYHLRVTAVKEGSQAAIAGLEQGDVIVGVLNTSSAPEAAGKVSSTKLLENLATAESNTKLSILFKRLNADGRKSKKIATKKQNMHKRQQNNEEKVDKQGLNIVILM